MNKRPGIISNIFESYAFDRFSQNVFHFQPSHVRDFYRLCIQFKPRFLTSIKKAIIIILTKLLTTIPKATKQRHLTFIVTLVVDLRDCVQRPFRPVFLQRLFRAGFVVRTIIVQLKRQLEHIVRIICVRKCNPLCRCQDTPE